MTEVVGAWRIESVQVNAETVVDEGFDRLVVGRDRMSIEPAGIEFSVSQSTPKSAVLESRAQIFFAEYSKKDDRLTIELSRPAFRDKIRLNASLLA